MLLPASTSWVVVVTGDIRGWRLPGPAVTAHVGEGALCGPAEQLFCPFGAGLELGHITRTALDDLVGNGDAIDCFEAIYNIEHAEPLAGAEVEGERCRRIRFEEMFDGSGMGFREIHHMQVVADACAIGGGVVIAEHA